MAHLKRFNNECVATKWVKPGLWACCRKLLNSQEAEAKTKYLCTTFFCWLLPITLLFMKMDKPFIFLKTARSPHNIFPPNFSTINKFFHSNGFHLTHAPFPNFWPLLEPHNKVAANRADAIRNEGTVLRSHFTADGSFWKKDSKTSTYGGDPIKRINLRQSPVFHRHSSFIVLHSEL